jgi:hypothetical protein
MTQAALNLGLKVQTELAGGGYTCKILGEATAVAGTGESLLEALSGAFQRWRQLN